MRIAELDYELPDELVARHPTTERDGARLLVVERSALIDSWVRTLPERLSPADLLVVNDSKVLSARVEARREPSGGRVELLFLSALSGGAEGQERFEALGRASKPLRPGTRLVAAPAGADPLHAVVVERAGDGTLVLDVRAPGGVFAWLAAHGEVPLPPYMDRAADAADRVRYQTVYAAAIGSVAAPTAGLHLTEAALTQLRANGVRLARVTLHVGLGTFKPVTVDDLDDHPMHEERCTVSADVVDAIAETRARGGRVVAVGTTTVRTLESAAVGAADGQVRAFDQATRLLIQPGYRFRVVDALLTNFHQPRSTLLALVGAFVGVQRLKDAYAAAVARRYRFLSYGDAMWLPTRLEADSEAR